MNKTKKLIAGVSSASIVVMLSGCSDQAEGIPPEPTDSECQDWDWDAYDGVYECDEGDSRFFGHYYYGGTFYKDRGSLTRSSAFKSYKNSSSFKGGGSNSRSGFGGFKGFGG